MDRVIGGMISRQMGVLVVRRILATIVILAMFLGHVSDSHGNIIGFPGLSNPPQAFDLDAATANLQRAVESHQATADIKMQCAPLPARSTERQSEEQREWWLAVSHGMGSPESFPSAGGVAFQAALGSLYKFFLSRPLSWVCCGVKLILPEAPSRSVSKIPIY